MKISRGYTLGILSPFGIMVYIIYCMLYKLAHVLRDHLPWIWDMAEWLNGLLFSCRYGKRLRKCGGAICNDLRFKVVRLSPLNVNLAVDFFAAQPKEAFRFFRPHGFDQASLLRLCRNKGFLAFLVLQDERVVGYFFLRSFFTGKCFRGYMTDYEHRRMGINRVMGLAATNIAITLGLRMFGSISPENQASMLSAQAVNEVKILQTLENGDYFVEYLPKK